MVECASHTESYIQGTSEIPMSLNAWEKLEDQEETWEEYAKSTHTKQGGFKPPTLKD